MAGWRGVAAALAVAVVGPSAAHCAGAPYTGHAPVVVRADGRVAGSPLGTIGLDLVTVPDSAPNQRPERAWQSATPTPRGGSR